MPHSGRSILTFQSENRFYDAGTAGGRGFINRRERPEGKAASRIVTNWRSGASAERRHLPGSGVEGRGMNGRGIKARQGLDGQRNDSLTRTSSDTKTPRGLRRRRAMTAQSRKGPGRKGFDPKNRRGGTAKYTDHANHMNGGARLPTSRPWGNLKPGTSVPVPPWLMSPALIPLPFIPLRFGILPFMPHPFSASRVPGRRPALQ
jgi:hypothetical protein